MTTLAQGKRATLVATRELVPSASRVLTILGGLAMAMGVGVIVYAHAEVEPYLQRSVDVARRLMNDGTGTLAMLAEGTASSDALRAPSEELIHRQVATLKPSIAVFDAFADTLRVIPGASDGGAEPGADRKGPADGLSGGLAKVRRAIDVLVGEAEHVRAAAVALEVEKSRQEFPSAQPAIAAATARIHEAQAILAETNPARAMTMLADLIAGLYLFLGGALMTIGRLTSH